MRDDQLNLEIAGGLCMPAPAQFRTLGRRQARAIQTQYMAGRNGDHQKAGFQSIHRGFQAGHLRIRGRSFLGKLGFSKATAGCLVHAKINAPINLSDSARIVRRVRLNSPLSLEELLGALPSGSRVLDLGCGGGTFQYGSYPSLQIFAFDEAVHEKVRDFPANAHFVCAGASALPDSDGVFDLIVVNFAFEHFADPVAALKEVDRVAKARAYVWISMPNAGSFEDQLYRNLFSGGGHLQSPTVERFLRLVYAHTSLKLVSLLDLPAGFTWLGDSEELRHLTWAIIDALKKSVAIDAQNRSGHIFVLQKYPEAGPGYREYLHTCHKCGSPHGTSEAECDPEREHAGSWTCNRCGALNESPSNLAAVQLDDVARALRLQWERFPETHPARLREMVAERGRWGQELEQQLASLRHLYAQLHTEFEQRSQWALELDRELAQLKTFKGYLKFLRKKLSRLRW